VSRPAHLPHAHGVLCGLALGDVLGAPIALPTSDENLACWPPAGPRAFEGTLARISDTTQMALAVAEALPAAAAGDTRTSHAAESAHPRLCRPLPTVQTTDCQSLHLAEGRQHAVHASPAPRDAARDARSEIVTSA
jgi:hypothetical protein